MTPLFAKPAQHQRRHNNGPRRIGRNFGMVLGNWDWMFGTIYVPRGREEFALGLEDGEHEEYNNIWGLYALPFRKIFRRLRRRPRANGVVRCGVLSPPVSTNRASQPCAF